jgi:uracil DNA glycosylase
MSYEPSPWIATGISVLSLLVASLNFFRDRAALKATSIYEQGWNEFTASIRINIVNKGRRPIILHSWGGAATKGRFIRRIDGIKWMTQQLTNSEGHTLTEQKPYEHELQASDLEFDLQDNAGFMIDDVWIVDTVGRRHNIKDIRKNVAQLRAWAAKQHPSRFV